MGPGDDALLSDLLDGRLDPEAEATLRRRLHEEPDLADAWDDLRRIREGLRALPGPAVPPGFSAGVRARVAGDRVEAAEGGEPPRSIAVYAVAAVLAAGLGIGAYALAIRGQSVGEVREDADVPKTTAPSFEEVPETYAFAGRNAEVPLPAEGGTPDVGSAAGVVVEKAATPSAETPAETGVSTTPRLRGPSGAVPPGLREPSDDPTPRTGPPASRGGTSGSGGGSGGGGAGGSVPALGLPPAPPTPQAPAVTTPPPPAKPSPPPRPVASDPRFQEGVDEVLMVGARDLEEGHAHLFVLLGELRATEAVVPEAREADAPAPAQGEDAKKVEPGGDKSKDPRAGAEAGEEAAATGATDRERADGPAAPEPAPAASPAPTRTGGSPAPPSQPPPPPVLGTVLLRLTPDQLDALRARLEPEAASRKAATERRRAEPDAARLRVRVLVVSK